MMAVSKPNGSKERNLFDGHNSLCTRYQKVIVSTEKRSTHKGNNKACKEVRQYRLDGGVFARGTRSVCDYLVLNDKDKIAYLIELKGQHTEDAISQIQKAEQAVKPSLSGCEFLYRIVFSGSGTHSLTKTALVAWKEKHGKCNNVFVASYARGIYEEEI